MKKYCCSNKKKNQEGYGLIDYIVNKLPEIHIPGYQYCGPGTKLQKRLARGDPGINKLDRACKDHDIAYSSLKNSQDRREADKKLIVRAFPRAYSQDAKLGERAAALLVSGLMGAKIGLTKMGLGVKKKRSIRRRIKGHRTPHRRRPVKKLKKRRTRKHNACRGKKRQSKIKHKSIAFGKLIRGVKASIKKSKIKSPTLNSFIKAAIRSARDLKRGKTVKLGRILKLPKFGTSIPISNYTYA